MNKTFVMEVLKWSAIIALGTYGGAVLIKRLPN